MRANLGSNTKVIPGWINVDSDAECLAWFDMFSPMLKEHFVLEDIIAWLSSQEDDTFEAVAMIQVLDHFTLPQAFYIVENVHRILKPDGVFRLMVEDLDGIIKAWQDGSISKWANGQPNIWVDMIPDMQVAVLMFGNMSTSSHYSGHKMLYTIHSLSDLLMNVGGFDEVHEFFGERISYIPDWDTKFDTQPEHSLTVEAIK
jgi:predicted SAM-dependent methyltransferase